MAESDDTIESELLNRSLSMWNGGEEQEQDNNEEEPRPLDLHTAASIGQRDVVSEFIRRGSESVNRRNVGGWTALMYASYIGHVSVASALLAAGAVVSAACPLGHTPLMLAASCGNYDVARLLIQRGADVEAVDRRGLPALLHCTATGHQDLVRLLLSHGADANVRETTFGHTPLMEAAMAGHEIIVHHLLKQGARVRDTDRAGDTARSLAAMFGHTKVVGMIDGAAARGAAGPSSRSLRRPPALSDDHSSSDEWSECERAGGRAGVRRGGRRGPSIHDGPQALAQLTNIGSDDDESAFFSANADSLCGGAGGAGGGGGDGEWLLAGRSREGSLESNEDSPSRATRPRHRHQRPPPSDRTTDRTTDHRTDQRRASPESGHPTGTPAGAGRGAPSAGRGARAAESRGVACGEPGTGPAQPGTEAPSPGPKDLSELLRAIGCSKYLSVLEAQDVDLRVFLTLSEGDLKEVGIGLFGPRRKMAVAISRWHAGARPASGHPEQAYADHLHDTTQGLGRQLNEAREEVSRVTLELRQERDLRLLAESGLHAEQRRRQAAREAASRAAAALAPIAASVGENVAIAETIARLGETVRELNSDLEELRGLAEDHT